MGDSSEQYQDEQDYSSHDQSISYLPASKLHKDINDSAHLIKVLTDHVNFLENMRREMRGEQLYQDKDGETFWVQMDKPMFIKLDKNDQPIKRLNKKTGKQEYITNDDAVNEVISILKSCGLNPITPLTNIDENEIRADLLEMESKIAVLLTVKRKKWGIDKAEYPATVGKIKMLIKDARYRAKDGTVLRALRTITSRIEQSSDRQVQKTVGERIRSPFS